MLNVIFILLFSLSVFTCSREYVDWCVVPTAAAVGAFALAVVSIFVMAKRNIVVDVWFVVALICWLVLLCMADGDADSPYVMVAGMIAFFLLARANTDRELLTDKQAWAILITEEYDFPYDDYKMQEYYDTFFNIISGHQPEGRPIPEDAELRTEKENAIWNHYFNIYVQPALDAKAAGETYKVAVNYTYSLNEKEAYETEMQKYGTLWSEKYKEDAEAQYKKFKHHVEVLQSKN